MPNLRNCIILVGPELTPHHCDRFAWERDTISAIDLGPPVRELDAGALVILPGLTNGHTHIGGSPLPDAATGLTPGEALARPDGLQHRMFAELPPPELYQHVVGHLLYMARSGTMRHIDFREQGPDGSKLLRAAAKETGLDSIILGQFAGGYFSPEELAANLAPLPEPARNELIALLALADGFSGETMNDLTDPAWAEIRTVTTERHRLRAVHCLEDAAGRAASVARTGQDDLARALAQFDPQLIVHLNDANAAEIERLARSGRTAVLNPRADAALGRPLPPVAALLASGVNLLLGTGHVMLNSPNLFAELDFTYKLARAQSGEAGGPDPAAILRMVTSNIRPVLGNDHFGALEKGLPADFTVLDFFHPHLRATRNLVASVVTRVTPEDVIATFRHGQALWRLPEFNV